MPNEPAEADARRTCPNCGRVLDGPWCSGCGQRNGPLRQSLRNFLQESLEESLGVDGRVWRTLGVLFVHPGRLTNEHFAGRRARYLGPQRIYLAASVLFFFVLTILDPVGRVERAAVGGDADSTATVAARLDAIERRLVAITDPAPHVMPGLDSLETFLSQPATADSSTTKSLRLSVDLGPLSPADSGSGAARELWIERRRLEWQRAVLDTLDRDRLIRPKDYDDAAALLHPDSTARHRVGFVGIEAEGRTARDLQNARTATERRKALAALARRAVSHLPLVMFLLMPVFAAMLKLLHARSDVYYTEHVTFALHAHAFGFVVLTAVAIVEGYLGAIPGSDTASLVLLGWTPLYFVMAMRKVYGHSWRSTMTRALAMGFLYPVLIGAGLVLSVYLAAELG